MTDYCCNYIGILQQNYLHKLSKKHGTVNCCSGNLVARQIYDNFALQQYSKMQLLNR